MRKKGLILFIAVLGFSVLMLSQCTGMGKDKPADTAGTGKPAVSPNNKNGPAKTGKTLKTAVSMQPAEFGYLETQANRYMQDHEGITIELQNIPASEFYTQLKKFGQMGKGPDIMLLDNTWVNEFAALGFLRPLDENFTGEQQAARVPGMLKQVKWNGYLWAVPKDIDPYILVWNKKMAADGKFDHAPATGEEMLAWSKTFAKPEEGKFGIYWDTRDALAFISLLSALGLNAPEGTHPLQKLNDPVILKNLQAFLAPQDTAWNGKTFAKNFPAAGPGFKPWDQFGQGKIAGMLTTVSEYKSHRNSGPSLSAIPFAGAGGTGTWLKGRSYSISSHSAVAVEAMDWIKEMTSLDASSKNWTDSGLLPALSMSYSVSPLIGDESYASYSWLVREGRVLPVELDGGLKLDRLNTEIAQLLKGETDLKGFTDQVSKQWNPAGANAK